MKKEEKWDFNKIEEVLGHQKVTKKEKEKITELIKTDIGNGIYWIAEKMYLYGIITGKRQERKKKKRKKQKDCGCIVGNGTK